MTRSLYYGIENLCAVITVGAFVSKRVNEKSNDCLSFGKLSWAMCPDGIS